MTKNLIPQRKDLALELMVFCRVRPLERPRRAFNQRHFYQPKENQLQLFEELIPYQALVSSPLEEPVIMDVTCFFAKGKATDPWPTAPIYGDEDNLRKAVNDALVEQRILANDRFVIGGETFKVFADSDYAHIKIWRVRQ